MELYAGKLLAAQRIEPKPDNPGDQLDPRSNDCFFEPFLPFFLHSGPPHFNMLFRSFYFLLSFYAAMALCSFEILSAFYCASCLELSFAWKDTVNKSFKCALG